MNVYLIVGAVITVAVIVLLMFSHRQYKRVGRRCDGKDCGNTRVKRVCKIVLAPREIVSLHNSQGKWRWWIRGVVKLTFTVCERKEKHNGAPRIMLMKTDYDPISLWHAYWVKWFYREQYYLTEPNLIEAVQRRRREEHLGSKRQNLDPQASETPPLSLDSLFQDYFEAISEIIGG